MLKSNQKKKCKRTKDCIFIFQHLILTHRDRERGKRGISSLCSTRGALVLETHDRYQWTEVIEELLW